MGRPFFKPGDAAAFKLLSSLAAMFALMALLVHSVLYMRFVHPLGLDAPLDRFSEARAVRHVRVLAHDISSRQEGSPGLREAATYIKTQLETYKEQARPNLKIEIEEPTVAGSFNMMFLGHSISFGYRNHTNVIMRISSAEAQDTDPSVLINAHFDSPLGSPGAGDCGSCVASLLELVRLIINSGWVPPQPIIFLFNGAEELFMLGAHGFMTTSKWRDYIGAAINVEASGIGGPDLVCQSGPSSWPSRVYAESAVYPMAHSAAQDVFPVIPGDTDYRMFSQDYGNAPGLDIIFLLGGYFYHTSYDTVDRLLPGSIQARGENLFSLLKAFANSPALKTAYERESIEAATRKLEDGRAVFFDYFSWFLIYYPRNAADLLHFAPMVVFLVMPLLLYLMNTRSRSWFTISVDFIKGTILHAVGIVLAALCPVLFSMLRLLFSRHAMNWFAHPFLAFAMFIPCSLLGLLIPRMIWHQIPLSQATSVSNISKEELADESRFWGAFGFYAIITMAYSYAGLSGGFLTLFIAASMLLAWISFCLVVRSSSRQLLRSTIIYVIPLVPCLTYTVYFSGFLIQFIIEKMGMMGSIPPPLGFFIPDIIVSAIIGVATGWCMGPLIPIYGRWLAKSSVLQFLLHLTVIAMALSSQFFPYSNDAPKRVVVQNTYVTRGSDQVLEASYDFSVVDSNALPYLFKHVPEAAKELDVGLSFSVEEATPSPKQTFMALFPVSFMFSGSVKFSARSDEIKEHYPHLPHLSVSKVQTTGKESRKVYLELSLGSLEEVWVAVLNVTGPLSGWSFADQTLPDPEVDIGGPPSYICRLSGASSNNWTFWLEASSSEDLRVDVAVLDQYMVDAAKRLKGLFPDWVDVTAYSSFISSYTF